MSDSANCATQLPLWLSYFQALSTPAIAILAVAVAFGQWLTARRKTVLDLFEKRYTAYEKIRTSIVDLVLHSADAQKDVDAFHMAAQLARFLFGSEIRDFFSDLGKKSTSFTTSVLAKRQYLRRKTSVTSKQSAT